GLQPFAQHAAIGKTETLRGKRRHLVHRVLERDDLQIARVPSEHAYERAIAARMWVRLTEDRHLAVRSDHRRRMLENALQILFVDRVEDTRAAALLHDPEDRVCRVVDRGFDTTAFRHLVEAFAVE